MRAPASLHANQARLQVGEERGHLLSLQLLSQHGLSVLINSVDLEHVLGQVDTSGSNLHGGRPFRFKWLINASTLARRCRSGWGRPSHYWLPFFTWCISGSRSPLAFLVELGAAIKVASMAVPFLSSRPLAASVLLTVASI